MTWEKQIANGFGEEGEKKKMPRLKFARRCGRRGRGVSVLHLRIARRRERKGRRRGRVYKGYGGQPVRMVT
jgi:hypothetical protein